MFRHHATDWHQASKSTACAFPLQVCADDCDADLHDGQLGANAVYAEVFAQHRRYSEELWLVLVKVKKSKPETHGISILRSWSGVLHLCAVRLHFIH